MRKLEKGTWIVPSNTFFATGAMVQEAGNQVKLADCSREDFSMDLESLRKAHTGKEIGVVLTHVGGGIAKDYEAIAAYCEAHDLLLVEDAAHAFGAENRSGYRAGDLGQAAVFSFYPTKAIPVGEGGLVTTVDPEFAVELREFRNYGKHRDHRGTIRYTQGFNFRMDEWTAAVACHQMDRLGSILARRKADFERLSALIPPLVTHEGVSNHYKYIVHADVAKAEGLKRFAGKVYASTDQLVTALGFLKEQDLPNSDWVAQSHVCLPIGEGMYSDMSDAEIMAYLRSDV
jgi:dTDP-4-amino-4,6-dideoxygalactose transaminase